MRKHILPVLFIMASVTCVWAQSHAWQWAKQPTQPNNVTTWAHGTAVATDKTGNVIMVGYFETDSITFGTYTLYNTDATGATEDIFVAKYDSAGNVLWAIGATGNKNDDANAVVTDNGGNIYVAGAFYSDSLLFGGLKVYNNGPDSTDDIYVAKINSDGNLLWLKGFGGNYYDGATGLTIDPWGDLLIGGFYRSDSLTFGISKLYDRTGSRNLNSFLAKLNSAGGVSWVNTSVSTGLTETYGISTDNNGNTFSTGRFTGGSVTFGTQTVNNIYPGNEDIFVAKSDSAGNVIWVQGAGGTANDVAYSIANDPQGNVYITGFYNSNVAYFGAIQITNDTSNLSSDVFVTKYDTDGNALWVNTGNGDNNDVGEGIATDAFGNVYITGYYYSAAMVFGTDTLFNFDQTGATDDIFTVGYDTAGNLLSATTNGGLSYDAAYSLASDYEGNIYLTGIYRSDDIVFGNTTLVNPTHAHDENPVLAKYSCVNPVMPVITQAGDTLRSSAASNNQWYFNGAAISGATHQIYVATQSGTYTVEVINGPMCKAMSAGVTTGIKNLLNDAFANVYPNPAHNYVTVNVSDNLIGSWLELTDAIGGTIVKQPISNNKFNLLTGNLARGIYYVKIMSANCGYTVKKLVLD